MQEPIAKIGPYELFALETGTFALDGGAMFGVVPKTIWAKRYPCDERNRIHMASRSLLLVGGGRKILIDVGLGFLWEEKEVDIYAIDHHSNDLFRSLKASGLSPEDVTDVILTHLHFDHAGGSTRRDEKTNEVVPTFPRATYHLQEKHYQHARNPTLRDRASFRPIEFEPLAKAGCLKLYYSPQGFDHDEEILPGIQALICHGHTPALQMLRVFDPNRSIVYCADTIPTHAHFPLPWVMGYDLLPLVALEEKRALLERCQKNQWEIFFEHDAKHALVALRFDEKGQAKVSEEN